MLQVHPAGPPPNRPSIKPAQAEASEAEFAALALLAGSQSPVPAPDPEVKEASTEPASSSGEAALSQPDGASGPPVEASASNAAVPVTPAAAPDPAAVVPVHRVPESAGQAVIPAAQVPLAAVIAVQHVAGGVPPPAAFGENGQTVSGPAFAASRPVSEPLLDARSPSPLSPVPLPSGHAADPGFPGPSAATGPSAPAGPTIPRGVPAPESSMAPGQLAAPSAATAAPFQAREKDEFAAPAEGSNPGRGDAPRAFGLKVGATNPVDPMEPPVAAVPAPGGRPEPKAGRSQGFLDARLAGPEGPAKPSEPTPAAPEASKKGEAKPAPAEPPPAHAEAATPDLGGPPPAPRDHAAALPRTESLALQPTQAPSSDAQAAIAARPAAPVWQAHVPSLAQQVEGGIRWMLRNASPGAELQLHPEALGRVRIELRVEGGDVHARLWASDPKSLPVLQEHRAFLEVSLKEQGLNLGSFDLRQQSNQPHPQFGGQGSSGHFWPTEAPAPRQDAPIRPAETGASPRRIELIA